MPPELSPAEQREWEDCYVLRCSQRARDARTQDRLATRRESMKERFRSLRITRGCVVRYWPADSDGWPVETNMPRYGKVTTIKADIHAPYIRVRPWNAATGKYAERTERVGYPCVDEVERKGPEHRRGGQQDGPGLFARTPAEGTR